MPEHELGHYTGRLILQPLPDGRRMRVIEDFGFMEADGLHWPVPPRSTVDGASIPQVLWSLIGGPFEGKYRDASVVHDYYCAVRSADWRSVHRMFYGAMLVSGVSVRRAKVMYVAVYFAGPRWDDLVVENVRLGSPAVPTRPVDEDRLLDEDKVHPTALALSEAIDCAGISALDWDSALDRDSSPASAPPSRAVIQRAQQQLHDLGFYRGAIDGVFGPQTQRALQGFQQNNSLFLTGSLDQRTMKELFVRFPADRRSEITLRLDKFSDQLDELSDMLGPDDPSLRTLEVAIDLAVGFIPGAEGSPRGISVGHLATLDLD